MYPLPSSREKRRTRSRERERGRGSERREVGRGEGEGKGEGERDGERDGERGEGGLSLWKCLNCTRYVGSIHWDLTEDDVKSVFQSFGAIKSLQLLVCVFSYCY
jgi:hypothetical protein